jgi:simple sugar transport system ATP-binding protein
MSGANRSRISYIPEDRQQVGMVADMTLAENMAIKSYYREPFAKRGILQPKCSRIMLKN